MSSNLKILLLKKNSRKPKTKFNIDTIIEKVKFDEIKKLENPVKGQLFVHLDENDKYYFYQFTGKKWVEIK